MHSDLRSFLSQLRQESDLVEIQAEVDPYLELPEIHRRIIAAGGPALLFTNIKGSHYPVVTNLFGTARRVEMAVGPKPETLIQKLTAAMDELLPPRLGKLWTERHWLWELTKIGAKIKGGSAPVLECRDEKVNLQGLPALTSWPDDGGPFITQPLVYTEHPTRGTPNLGMYRMQILAAQEAGMHWQIHKGGGFHYYEAENLGQSLPVTVFLGGPPVLTIAAITALPENISELIFASLLLGQKIALSRTTAQLHPFIAGAEFALCGTVAPQVRRPEGPFGDHYGYYSLIHDFPVLEVQKVYHRRDAIFPATVVGKPRQEDYFIGEFMQRLLAPLFPLIMPGVKALWSYGETGFHSLTVAVVRESYYREALTYAFRILGEGQLSLTKFLIVTDHHVDLTDFKLVLETVLERFDPARDLVIINETAMDTLDYTGRRFNRGSKAIMTGLGDPERVLPREYQSGSLPGIDNISSYCAGCLLLSGGAYTAEPDLAAKIVSAGQEQLKEWPLVIIMDDINLIQDQTTFMWTVFTRFDPARDLFARYEVRDNKIIYQGPVVIDARMKPFYPAEVEPSEVTVKQVKQRWPEIFADRQIEY